MVEWRILGIITDLNLAVFISHAHFLRPAMPTVQSQKAVSAYITSRQILPLGFVKQWFMLNQRLFWPTKIRRWTKSNFKSTYRFVLMILWPPLQVNLDGLKCLLEPHIGTDNTPPSLSAITPRLVLCLSSGRVLCGQRRSCYGVISMICACKNVVRRLECFTVSPRLWLHAIFHIFT